MTLNHIALRQLALPSLNILVPNLNFYSNTKAFIKLLSHYTPTSSVNLSLALRSHCEPAASRVMQAS